MLDHDALPGSDLAFPSGGGARPAPGRVTLTSRLASPRQPTAPAGPAPAPVQRKEAAAPAIDPFAIHLAAEEGVAGASSPLPYHDELVTSFGRHGAALDGARAQIGGPAAEASIAIGAHAYATGDRVAFASAPDRALAAHEAAHVVQQRAGVSLSGGVGAAGNPFEQHADLVAAAFARGERAEPILDRMPSGGGAGVQRAVQRKETGAPVPADETAERLVSGGVRVYKLYAQLRALEGTIRSKGTHLLGNDKGLIAAAKELHELAEQVHGVWEQAQGLAGEVSEATERAGAIIGRAGDVIKALDLIGKLADDEALNAFLADPGSKAKALAWAHDATETFKSAAEVIPNVPGIPGFVTEYWKGLLNAPAVYLAAFETIMDAYQRKIDVASEGGHEDTSTFSYGGKQVWAGPLTRLYMAASEDMRRFMDDHRKSEGGVDLWEAEPGVARALLVAAIQRDGKPAEWTALIRRHAK